MTRPDPDPIPPPGLVPPGTTELGIDIIRVERIRATLVRFGARFSRPFETSTRASSRYAPEPDFWKMRPTVRFCAATLVV